MIIGPEINNRMLANTGKFTFLNLPILIRNENPPKIVIPDLLNRVISLMYARTRVSGNMGFQMGFPDANRENESPAKPDLKNKKAIDVMNRAFKI